MTIHGINKLTLLDYPEHMAALLFTGGCNMRCPFCHNASLVLDPSSQPVIPENEIFEFLVKRRGVLEGICISGGEPTLQHDLPDFMAKLRKLGYCIKLDTNGTNPQMLSSLIANGLVDYVAVDIKSSVKNYTKACGLSVDMDRIKESVQILMNSDIEYEFRTTVVQELHDADDFVSIGKWLSGSRAYYLQSFKDSGDLVGGSEFHAPSRAQMEQYKELLVPYIKKVELRGVD